MDAIYSDVIEQLEKNIDSKYLRMITANLLEKITGKSEYIPLIRSLFELTEKYFNERDYGCPGMIFNFIRSFETAAYHKLLLESIQRKPTILSVLLLSDLIEHGSDIDRIGHLKILNEIASNSLLDELTRRKAKYYVDYFESNSLIRILRSKYNEYVERFANLSRKFEIIDHGIELNLHSIVWTKNYHYNYSSMFPNSYYLEQKSIIICKKQPSRNNNLYKNYLIDNKLVRYDYYLSYKLLMTVYFEYSEANCTEYRVFHDSNRNKKMYLVIHHQFEENREELYNIRMLFHGDCMDEIEYIIYENLGNHGLVVNHYKDYKTDHAVQFAEIFEKNNDIVCSKSRIIYGYGAKAAYDCGESYYKYNEKKKCYMKIKT